MTAEEDWTAMTEPARTQTMDEATHRQWGKQLFNHVWQLMERDNRTPDEDALMIHETHASLYHWMQGGEPANFARGEWQVSRVYCVLGQPEPAKYHAQRVLDICQRYGIGDWDLAFAYEALARAYAVAGETEQANQYLAQARTAGDEIAEECDRELLLGDLQTVPV
jgi:hypothetical protein